MSPQKTAISAFTIENQTLMNTQTRNTDPQKNRKFAQFRDAETISFEEVPASKLPVEVRQRWASIIQAQQPAPAQKLPSIKMPSGRVIWSALVVCIALMFKVAVLAIFGLIRLFSTALSLVAGAMASVLRRSFDEIPEEAPESSPEHQHIEVNVQVRVYK